MAQLFKPPVNYRNNDALPLEGFTLLISTQPHTIDHIQKQRNSIEY